jgi:glycerol transport system ATP-binding protein
MSLTLDCVTKIVGSETHIRGISMTLEKGTINVLLGGTLSGKTSLMRLMAGLDHPSSGRIVVDGRDVTGLRVRDRKVAMVYQQFINYPTLSVYENIAAPLRVARLPRTEIERRVRDAARLLRLEPMLDRLPAQLSGGQQQRTAIARALVKGADLVLMDEPLANLDYKLREELREELPRIFGASGAVFVYATTEPTEALLLGGNTATLFEGAMTQFGPTPAVYRRPIDIVTARVFSDPPLNAVAATKSGPVIALATGGTCPAAHAFLNLPDGVYTIGFRAHQAKLGGAAGDAITLHGTVLVSEITGSESYIHVNVAGVPLVALADGIRKFDPGTEIELQLDPRRLFVFDAAGRLVSAPPQARAA